MKRFTFPALLIVATFSGCTATRDAQLTTQQQARQAAVREANARQYQAAQQRRAEDKLRHKFARYTTAELMLMDARYQQFGGAPGQDLHARTNAHALHLDTRTIERVLEIERELLRRWQAGDTQAWLPEFASLQRQAEVK